MKVLLDECVDWRLIRDLSEFEVSSVRQAGWSGIQNGELLARAAAEYDVLVTVDSTLAEQDDVVPLGVVVIRGRSTRLIDLQRLLGAIKDAIRQVRHSEVRVVSWRHFDV